MGIGPVVTTWSEWAEVFNKQEVWLPVVHEILRKEDIACQEIKAGFPGTSAVFILDEAYVLKIYPGLFISDHEREWPVLKLLENIYDKPILITSGMFIDEKITWPYAILRFTKGSAYRDISDLLNEDEMEKFIEKLAMILQKIHRLPYDDLKTNSAYLWSSSASHLQKSVEQLVELPFFSQPDFRNDLFAFLEKAVGQLKQQKQVLVHGDLTEDHLFFNKVHDEWVFSDVIDWGDAHIAPVVYDLVVLWSGIFNAQPKYWEMFLQHYYGEESPVTPEFKSRFVAMLFLHPFSAGLIKNAYYVRAIHEQYFPTVQAFIDWVFKNRESEY